MSPATVEGAGVELAYDERGSGEPLVLVHGTASTRAIWDEVRASLGDGFRTIAYDRRAYGDSGEPEGYERTSVEEHADDLIALLRNLDLAPAYLCGHSFGAMTCLDTIIREPDLVRAAVLIEPPMLWLGPEGTEATSLLLKEVQESADKYGAIGAIAAFTRLVCGDGALEIVGSERAQAALECPRGFGADLPAVNNYSVSGRVLRSIDKRIVFVAGTRTPPAYRDPTVALAQAIPGAELREGDSGHLVPNEAPDVVAAAIRELPAQP